MGWSALVGQLGRHSGNVFDYRNRQAGYGLFDPATRQLVWRGSAAKTLDMKKDPDLIREHRHVGPAQPAAQKHAAASQPDAGGRLRCQSPLSVAAPPGVHRPSSVAATASVQMGGAPRWRRRVLPILEAVTVRATGAAGVRPVYPRDTSPAAAAGPLPRCSTGGCSTWFIAVISRRAAAGTNRRRDNVRDQAREIAVILKSELTVRVRIRLPPAIDSSLLWPVVYFRLQMIIHPNGALCFNCVCSPAGSEDVQLDHPDFGKRPVTKSCGPSSLSTSKASAGHTDMSFANEQTLVTLFLSRLNAARSPWGTVQVATEFYYQRGRTDIIAYTADESVIAVEAKLADWRTALQQAFRNRCFAHRSYILLPKTAALRAHCYAGEFDRRQVGICYLEGGDIVVLHPSIKSEPLEPWLSLRAKVHIEATGAGT